MKINEQYFCKKIININIKMQIYKLLLLFIIFLNKIKEKIKFTSFLLIHKYILLFNFL